MPRTMAEARSKRKALATHYGDHGLHDYGSVGEAQVALRNSGICHAAVDHFIQAEMAKWMWRNDASPKDAGLAFGLQLPGQ